IPYDARSFQCPVDQEGLIHLEVLACLDTPPAQDALVRIIAVECVPLHFMVLARMWRILVADPHLFHRVMYLTVSVVEIAHCTVELVIAQDTVHGDELSFVNIIPD